MVKSGVALGIAISLCGQPLTVICLSLTAAAAFLQIRTELVPRSAASACHVALSVFNGPHSIYPRHCRPFVPVTWSLHKLPPLALGSPFEARVIRSIIAITERSVAYSKGSSTTFFQPLAD